MFLENKYTKWYFNIINKSKSRELDKTIYFEKHHIIPKSFMGTNEKENIAELLPREHFICHLLLTKMTTGINKRKMSYALRFMMASTNKHQRNYKISSRIYEIIRKASSEAHKEYWQDSIKREEASIRQSNRWYNLDYRDSVINGIKDYWKIPENREIASNRSKEYWSDPVNRELNRTRQIEINKNPLIRASKASHGEDNGMFGKTHTPEVCDKLGKLASERFLGKSYEELYGKEKSDAIRESKSKKLKEYRKSHPVFGNRNPNAKSYKITSPIGTEYVITGELRKFCKEHKIGLTEMIAVAKNRLSNYKGWKITYL